MPETAKFCTQSNLININYVASSYELLVLIKSFCLKTLCSRFFSSLDFRLESKIYEARWESLRLFKVLSCGMLMSWFLGRILALHILRMN